MNDSLKKYHRTLIYFCLLLLIAYCFRRDSLIESQYTSDLTNRIQGARLQMDGKNPYSYCWAEGDSMRYYNPIVCSEKAPIITASPFFHHLLFPLANLTGRSISRIWLFVEYALLLSCLFFAFSLTENIAQAYCVAIFFTLFLFTETWKTHIFYGQYYLFFPFLSFLFFRALPKSRSVFFAIVAGFAAISFVLMKPTALVFFIPMIVFFRRISIKNILFFLLPVLLLIGFSILNSKERNLWVAYNDTIEKNIVNHISNDSSADAVRPPQKFEKWDGWDINSIRQASAVYPFAPHGECFNTWVFAKRIFNWQASLKIIGIITFLVMASMVIFFFIIWKKNPDLSFTSLVFFSYCLYICSEMLSPITRFQYYGVEWIFPLLLVAAYFKRSQLKPYVFLAIGLLLNISNTPYLKMRHSIGEIIMLLTLLWICFDKGFFERKSLK